MEQTPQDNRDLDPATGILRPILRYLWRGKVPAWAVLIWNLLLLYSDWRGRLEIYLETVREMGGLTGNIASAIINPWFTPLATTAAVLWILFMGEPRRGVIRHPRWPIIGWIAAGCFFTAIAATTIWPQPCTIWGVIELYIRTEIAKGIAGVPRNTPDVNSSLLRCPRFIHI
jgi:hypothetical protein